MSIFIHKEVADGEAYYFKPVKVDLWTAIKKDGIVFLASLLNRLKLSSLIGLINGREKIRDSNSIVLSQRINSRNLFECPRIFDMAQYPEVTPSGFVCFKQDIIEAELIGVGLVPLSKNRRLAYEALDLSPFDDFSITSAECRPASKNITHDLKGDYISLVSHWSYWKGFYHWFMDVLPRLRALDERHKILVKVPLSHYEKDTLEILGIMDRCVFLDSDHVSLENFTFVSPNSYSGSYDPVAIDYVRGLFLTKLRLTPSGSRRIYVTRLGESRCPSNELDVARVFNNAGWEIVDTKKFTLSDQIKMFSEASHVAGTHGGALVNLLWAPNDCKVFEFFPSNRLVATNENIALHLKMDYNAFVFPSCNTNPVTIDIEWLLSKINLTKGEIIYDRP